MDLKRLSSFILPSSAKNSSNNDENEAAFNRRRRSAAACSYTYVVDPQYRSIAASAIPATSNAKRSHSSRWESTSGRNQQQRQETPRPRKISPTLKNGRYVKKQDSATRQRAISLPQPQYHSIAACCHDDDPNRKLSPVQLFEKWTSAAGSSTVRNTNHRWSSFKYAAERRAPALCDSVSRRADFSKDGYDRIRTFTVDARGKLIDRGFYYRSKNNECSSTADVAESSSSSVVAGKVSSSVCKKDSFEDVALTPRNSINGVQKYKIWVCGTPEVGKTALINQFANCELANVLGRGDSLEDETGRIISILVNGKEIELSFIEQDIEEIEKIINYGQYWPSNAPDAAVLMYTVTSKESFLLACDALYHLKRDPFPKADALREHSECRNVPIFLVGNKIDLERQRVVQFSEGLETSKMFNCTLFLEISVGLCHRTNELLTSLLLKLKCNSNNGRRYGAAGNPSIALSSVLDQHKWNGSLGGSGCKCTPNSTPRSSKSRRSNSFTQAGPILIALGRRLARSCEDLIAKLIR